MTLILNGKGRGLLAKFGRLEAIVTVSANATKLKTVAVTLRNARRHER